MNWFQRLWSNPNTHIFVAASAPALMTAFPQYAAPLAAVGTLLGIHGGLTPEAPPAQPTTPPPQAPDYAAMAVALIAALKKK